MRQHTASLALVASAGAQLTHEGGGGGDLPRFLQSRRATARVLAHRDSVFPCTFRSARRVSAVMIALAQSPAPHAPGRI